MKVMAGTATAVYGPSEASAAPNGTEGGLEVNERVQHTFRAPAPRTSLLGALAAVV